MEYGNGADHVVSQLHMEYICLTKRGSLKSSLSAFETAIALFKAVVIIKQPDYEGAEIRLFSSSILVRRARLMKIGLYFRLIFAELAHIELLRG
ncbi:hypothetical protein AB4Z17_07100 [Paenibacillus sp. TAF43_2]|uniref:hypothetical protein n=1 Tax=Paenibacillus sp. TAF43_2 TaxID=3233069 RepID=UPI003F94B877